MFTVPISVGGSHSLTFGLSGLALVPVLRDIWGPVREPIHRFRAISDQFSWVLLRTAFGIGTLWEYASMVYATIGT